MKMEQLNNLMIYGIFGTIAGALITWWKFPGAPSIDTPIIATIVPNPTGTADCIASPLILKSLAASLKVKLSAETKEVYSPYECPAV